MRRCLYAIVCVPEPRAHAAASHSNAPVVHPPAPTPPPPGPGGGGDDGGGGGPSATTDPICYVDGSVLDTATDVHVRCPELDLVFKRAYDVVARWTYDAWGNVLSEAVSVPTLASVRYRFQGRERSAATGLINFRMRWYDPATGRWLSKDPIGLNGGLNLYAFCENNPSSMTDPVGQFSFDAMRAWVNGFAEGIVDAIKDGELEKGLAATVDGIIPFADPFSSVYTDDCGNLEDDIYGISQSLGEYSRNVMLPVAGARGAAALSSLRVFRFLNQNKYLRIGKGNIPKHRPLTDGPGQNVPTLRIGNGKPSPYNHFDLRLWGH